MIITKALPRAMYLLGAGAVALVLFLAVDQCASRASSDATEWKVRAEFAEARRKQAIAQRDSAIARYELASAAVDRAQVRHSSAAAAVRSRPELMADRDVAELVDAGDSLTARVDSLQAGADSAIAAARAASAASDSVTLAVRKQLEAERRAARPRLTASAAVLWDVLHHVPLVRTGVSVRVNDRLQLVTQAEASGPGLAGGIRARLLAGASYTFR